MVIRRWSLIFVGLNLALYGTLVLGCGGSSADIGLTSAQRDFLDEESVAAVSDYVVLAYNDLGMHCMNQDFSELCVLPPANTLRAQVIDRTGPEPDIVTSDVELLYNIPGNTESASKTNFWQYAEKLFGVPVAPNMGLFGFGMSGRMALTADNDYIAAGIPTTQMTDAGVSDPYQLAKVRVLKQGALVAYTKTVVPVSWEMRCDKCHTKPNISVASDILRQHNLNHGTTLRKDRPVLCAKCHADPALGAPGNPSLPSLSSAMHTAHSSRMGGMGKLETCYSCHPGPVMKCFRDVHKVAGMTCQSCHQGMKELGNPARRPWADEPRCGSCHNEPGHEYEQPGVLYRDSVGHNGVKCIACHGSPHAVTPTVRARDNVQAMLVQGQPGTIRVCATCHRDPPTEAFNHTRNP